MHEEVRSILSEKHYLYKDYKQRMTTKEWKLILLNHDDYVTYNGRVYDLVAKKLGFGVVEVYKDIKEISEGTEIKGGTNPKPSTPRPTPPKGQSK
jgi:hypothetical protein